MEAGGSRRSRRGRGQTKSIVNWGRQRQRQTKCQADWLLAGQPGRQAGRLEGRQVQGMGQWKIASRKIQRGQIERGGGTALGIDG